MTAEVAAPRLGRPGSAGVRRGETRLAWTVISPLILMLALVLGYPLLRTLWISFHQSTFISPEPVFVGFENYAMLVSSADFWQVAGQSVFWTVTTVALQTIGGVAIALVLDRPFIGRRLLRILVIVPWAMPGVLAGILWKFMYDPYLGLIALVSQTINPEAAPFAPLSNESMVLPAIIIAAVWKGAPLSILMYLAALQSRPQELMEAAMMDGANAFQTFRAVTLPSLMPVIQTTVLLTLIWTFNYFDLVFVMTGGGPNIASEIAPTFIYRLAFTEVDYGRSGAFAVMSMVIMGLFSIIYLRQLKAGEGR